MRQERIDANSLELTEKVVSIKRVTKTTKGGRNMSFSALVVAGNKKGQVGMGINKAIETPAAIEKTLTITKAQYTGDDLIAQDMAYDYDGNVKSIIASAPKGWTIEYENNGQSEKGTYEVTVTFTHPNYETVVKTVTLTIGSSMGALPFIIGGAALLGVATTVFFILKKKRK